MDDVRLAENKRFRFSILHLLYAVALVAFILAASREDDYAFSVLLRSACVGILLFGLARQIGDLWIARLQWKGATWQERNGWRLAIAVRCLAIAGLLYSSFESMPIWWLFSPEREDREYNSRIEVLSNALQPLMLVCALGFAPWYWRRTESKKKRAIGGVIAMIALAILLALSWINASIYAAMVHVAIHGVSVAEPLWLRDIISPTRTADLVAFSQSATARSLAALGLAIAAVAAIYAQSRAHGPKMRIAYWAVAAAFIAVSASQLFWIRQVAFPRVSPLLAESASEMEPRLNWPIAGAALFFGALATLWMELGRPPVCPRNWRRTGWYPHETRFFYELLVFSIVVENVELFKMFNDIGSVLFSDLNGVWVSILGVLSGLLQEPLQLAIVLLSLSGLFHRRQKLPSPLAQTPGPASLFAFFTFPILALAAYLTASAMIWSNFFYWITAA